MNTKEKLYLITVIIFMILSLGIIGNNDLEDYKKSYSYYLETNQLEDTQANYLLYLQLKEF